MVVSLLVFVLAVALPTALAEGDGKALYDKKCAMCHGKDGVAKKLGEGSANFNDAAWQEATPADDIVKVTTEGRNKMKPYKEKLSAEEIQSVAEYIKTLK
jgi:cytochrome c6